MNFGAAQLPHKSVLILYSRGLINVRLSSPCPPIWWELCNSAIRPCRHRFPRLPLFPRSHRLTLVSRSHRFPRFSHFPRRSVVVETTILYPGFMNIGMSRQITRFSALPFLCTRVALYGIVCRCYIMWIGYFVSFFISIKITLLTVFLILFLMSRINYFGIERVIMAFLTPCWTTPWQTSYQPVAISTYNDFLPS